MSEWQTKRVIVVAGGGGSEHEVSMRTAAAFMRALEARGVPATLHVLGVDPITSLLAAAPDVVLNAVHGRLGEDGCLQGLLELAQIPYTGSGVSASALAMDKIRSKCVFERFDVPTPTWRVVGVGDRESAPTTGYPLVVKPALEGSSVGVVIVRDPEGWSRAVDEASGSRGPLLVEDLVEGRELTVAVFDGRVLGTIEIVTATGVYDYEAKYLRDDTEYRFPAVLSPAAETLVSSAARDAFAALGCRGVARVDVMLSTDEQPYVLEVNTVPGMTETSLVPKIAAGVGIEFPDFVLSMLDAATTDSDTGGGAA